MLASMLHIYSFSSHYATLWDQHEKCITMILFASSFLNANQTKNNVNSASASSALTLISHRSYSTHTANRHLCGSGERNAKQRRPNVSFGKTMMQTLELQWLVKRHVSRRSDIEQWRNQAWSFSHYWVTLVWRH